jgi:protein TonB
MRRLTPSLPLVAVFVSILLHAAVLVSVAGVFSDPPTERMEPPPEQGGIELLPVEVMGVATETTPESPADSGAHPPAEQAPPATAQAEAPPPAEASPADHASSETVAAELPPPPSEPPQDELPPPPPEPPQADRAKTPDPLPPVPSPPVPSPPVPSPPVPSPPVPSPPVIVAAPQPLALSLAGTDSASNAEVLGQNIIPASPDDRARNRPPVYPREAIRRGQQGTVLVLIHVSPMGLAEGADILHSSGHASLDRAALDAVLSWRFRPAVRDGRAVPFEMRMQFVFAVE